MTDTTHEPRTPSGQHYALHPPGSLDEWRAAIHRHRGLIRPRARRCERRWTKRIALLAEAGRSADRGMLGQTSQ